MEAEIGEACSSRKDAYRILIESLRGRDNYNRGRWEYNVFCCGLDSYVWFFELVLNLGVF
jgi:hypothetical protein